MKESKRNNVYCENLMMMVTINNESENEKAKIMKIVTKKQKNGGDEK